MIQQEILKGLKLNVGNGGMSLSLQPENCEALLCHFEGCADYKEGECHKNEPKKATITKRDGGVFLNGVLIPFVSVNDLPEGEMTARQIGRMLLKSIKTGEIKKGDAAYASY